MTETPPPPYFDTQPLPKAPRGALRLITWNINSVRLRLPLIEKLIGLARPDVLCLQETKCPDEAFPGEALKALGFSHQAFHGMKSYNGVAVLSRVPLAGHSPHHHCGLEDCRHLRVELPGGVELNDVYIPAGGDIPDPVANPKFKHKLDFVASQAALWKKRKKGRPAILVGDLNIAPFETDVWSHKQLLDVVSHTPVEVDSLTKMRAAHDWVDVARLRHPEPQRLYTWWSYRNTDWRKSDRGRRLDHIWVTPDLAGKVKGFHILRGARDWTQPSDHVPVTVDLAI
jgi:exodeoxyribonuclease-3